jgi:hypothetical protein
VGEAKAPATLMLDRMRAPAASMPQRRPRDGCKVNSE